jgi:predicted Zn-dependent protease
MRDRRAMKQRTRSVFSMRASRCQARGCAAARRIQILLLFLLTILMAGCFTLMGGEQKVGDEAALQVEVEMGIFQQAELTAWVSEIGQRLVAVTDDPDRSFRFQIVDMAIPNAFALPGGHVYVSRGLLALVNSEDELAGVLGHEIGHVVGSHASRRVTLAAPFKIITGLTGWVTGIVTPRVGQAIRDGGDTLTDGLLVAPYGRQQERDADRIGLKLAAAAGWNPEGLADFLHTLGREEELRIGGERETSWLDSHPATPERVIEAKKRAAELERTDSPRPEMDRTALLAKLNGLLVGADVAGGVMVDNVFIQPEIGFTMELPLAWDHQNTPTQFIAAPEEGGAAILLRVVAEGDDPTVLMPQLEKELGRQIDSQTVSDGGLPGIRMRINQKTNQGRMTLEVAYFAAGGLILEVTCIAPEKLYESWSLLFDTTIRSARPPKASEIAALREERLRIAKVQSGESLAQLVTRVRSAWPAPRIAVMNGIEMTSKLVKGFEVKMMREEAYVPRAK